MTRMRSLEIVPASAFAKAGVVRPCYLAKVPSRACTFEPAWHAPGGQVVRCVRAAAGDLDLDDLVCTGAAQSRVEALRSPGLGDAGPAERYLVDALAAIRDEVPSARVARHADLDRQLDVVHRLPPAWPGCQSRTLCI